MKRETLSALSIDHAMGELPPETTELFEAYLALDPDARREADAAAKAVHVARTAVRGFPDLAPRPARAVDRRCRRLSVPWFSRAAAACLVLGVGVWIGRHGVPARRVAGSAPGIAHVPVTVEDGESPWAQYRLAYDARDGIRIMAQQP